MAVRSAFALLCFAFLCGLAAASSGKLQSETETELRTKNEGEAAGNQVLVAQAVESRVARGSKKGEKNACKEDPKSKECLRKQKRRNKAGKKQKNDKPKKAKGKKTKKNRNNKRRNNNRQKKNPGKPGKGGKKGSKKLRKNNRKKNDDATQAKKEKKKEAKKAKKITKKLLKQARKNNDQISRKNTKASNATVNLTCLTTAIQLLKFQKDNVNNFLSRHTRQIKQNALTTKKQGKKGEFAEPAARLIQSGGGNKSNLICGGSINSTGAKQLLNLTNLLDGCSAAIKTACTPPSGINQTFMTDCYEKSK